MKTHRLRPLKQDRDQKSIRVQYEAETLSFFLIIHPSFKKKKIFI